VLRGSHKCGRIEHKLVAGQTGADTERVDLLKQKLPLEYVEMNPGRFSNDFVLTPLSIIFSYIVTVSFIGGGNPRTWRKPPTCRKSMTNFITQCCIEITSPE
jgi:hypothetical protein